MKFNCFEQLAIIRLHVQLALLAHTYESMGLVFPGRLRTTLQGPMLADLCDL